MASFEVDGFGEAVAEDFAAGPPRVEPMVTRRVLEEFYQCLKGEQWRNQKNWNTPYDIYGWEGTVWDKSVDPPQLIGLELANNNLEGKIPDSVGKLKALRFLELKQNAVQGGGDYLCEYALSEALVRLPHLERVEMQNNELAGPLPPNLGEAKRLTVLRLDHNYVSGALPRSIGDLKNLRFLSLSHNALSGAVPEMLGQCVRLEVLWLDHNTIEGKLGPRLKNLRELTLLNVTHNHLDEAPLRDYGAFLQDELPRCRAYLVPQAPGSRAKGAGRAANAADTYSSLLGAKMG